MHLYLIGYFLHMRIDWSSLIISTYVSYIVFIQLKITTSAETFIPADNSASEEQWLYVGLPGTNHQIDMV